MSPADLVMPAPGEQRLSELQMIRQYLLWHATSTCQATCILCQDAIAYLTERGATPADILKLPAGRRLP